MLHFSGNQPMFAQSDFKIAAKIWLLRTCLAFCPFLQERDWQNQESYNGRRGHPSPKYPKIVVKTVFTHDFAPKTGDAPSRSEVTPRGACVQKMAAQKNVQQSCTTLLRRYMLFALHWSFTHTGDSSMNKNVRELIRFCRFQQSGLFPANCLFALKVAGVHCMRGGGSDTISG